MSSKQKTRLIHGWIGLCGDGPLWETTHDEYSMDHGPYCGMTIFSTRKEARARYEHVVKVTVEWKERDELCP
jgi:hypothetical protein